MRHRAGPQEVGLAQGDSTGPPARALSRVIKGNRKIFHCNFSGMADLTNFLAGIHKSSPLPSSAERSADIGRVARKASGYTENSFESES
jgi:hypothetical protein